MGTSFFVFRGVDFEADHLDQVVWADFAKREIFSAAGRAPAAGVHARSCMDAV